MGDVLRLDHIEALAEARITARRIVNEWAEREGVPGVRVYRTHTEVQVGMRRLGESMVDMQRALAAIGPAAQSASAALLSMIRVAERPWP